MVNFGKCYGMRQQAVYVALHEWRMFKASAIGVAAGSRGVTSCSLETLSPQLRRCRTVHAFLCILTTKSPALLPGFPSSC